MSENSALDDTASELHGSSHATGRSALPAVGSKRRRVPESQRSLSFILVALKNEVISIELKNENVITGTIAECDAAMNVTLIDAHIKSAEVSRTV
jgi:hypothetical protein